jgi:hypothetical protein
MLFSSITLPSSSSKSLLFGNEESSEKAPLGNDRISRISQYPESSLKLSTEFFARKLVDDLFLFSLDLLTGVLGLLSDDADEDDDDESDESFAFFST